MQIINPFSASTNKSQQYWTQEKQNRRVFWYKNRTFFLGEERHWGAANRLYWVSEVTVSVVTWSDRKFSPKSSVLISEHLKKNITNGRIYGTSTVSVPGDSPDPTEGNLTYILSLSFLPGRVRCQVAEVRGQGTSGIAHFLFRTWTTSFLSVRKLPKASLSLLSSVAKKKIQTDFLQISIVLFTAKSLRCGFLQCIGVFFLGFFSHRCGRCRLCRCPPPPPPRQGYHVSWWGHWARLRQLPLWTGSQISKIQQ